MARRRRPVPGHAGWWWQFGVQAYRRGSSLFLMLVRWGYVPSDAATLSIFGLDSRGVLDLTERKAEEMLERKGKRLGGDDAETVLGDDEFAAAYPITYQYLTQRKWSDGSPRMTSSVLIFVDGPIAKVMLRDREEGLCMWCASDSLWRAFDVLEAKLADPAADWRQDRVEEGQTASRKKKKG